MAGFVRRFGFVPGVETITQIEGVVIIDLPPPGSVSGVDTGVAAIVGEFADMTYATAVDGGGLVTSFIEPQEIFSSQDMLDKVGGWDETIGDFGISGGNGFASLRNKTYSRLIISPVNLASSVGSRYFRQLPLCASQTSALPVVPVQGATIPAGTEFRSAGGGRSRVAARVVFTALSVITAGTGGAITTSGTPALTQPFTVSGANFPNVSRPDGSLGIKKGDIVVIGNNNAGALQPLPASGNLGAGTYRVNTDASSGTPTVLQLERLDGANFDFVTAATIPYRIHVSSDADSAPVIVVGATTAGGYDNNDAGGFSIPTRPLTDNLGAFADGVWTALENITPAVVPPALTGDGADPLSGLGGRIHPSGMPYTVAIQRPNAPSSASIDALYAASFDALVSDATPISLINIVWSARTSATIRNKVKSHVSTADARLHGRMGLIRPELSVLSTSTVVGDADPGVGANRLEACVYNWPGERTYIPEAVNFRIPTADGLTTLDGILDIGLDARLASVLSGLPPELNPGQSAEPIPTLMSSVLGFQRGVPKLELNDYITIKQRGICALRMDRTAGPIFQSGVTTSLVSGQTNISRRRMSFFIEDSLADRLNQLVKKLGTRRNHDDIVAETDSFLRELKSEDNPAAQRIDDYQIDEKSGNTPGLQAKGIFVLIVRVRLLSTDDFIVLQAEIGENVVISQAA